MNIGSKGKVDYLVGGLRISLSEHSTTPGPRTHILGFTEGLRRLGWEVRLSVASEMPGLRRFAAVKEGSAATRSRSRLLLSDAIRIIAMAWIGLCTFVRTSRSPRPAFVYERAAVMQWMSLFHRWRRHIPVVVESNGIMSRETASDRNALALVRVAAFLERRLYRSADLVVAVSEALAAEIQTFASLPDDRILVLPNAVPFALLDSTPAPGMESRDAGKPLVIGFVGTIVPWQQLDLLIQALASQVNLFRPLTLEVIGDGPHLDDLRHLADALGVNQRITFHGPLPQAEAFKEMQSWDLGYAGHKGTVAHSMYHSPLKLYEYAGLSLGAIATPSTDADRLRNQGMPIWTFHDLETLSLALQHASFDAASLGRYREEGSAQVKRSNSWSSRAGEVVEALSAKRASFPVRTRGKRDV